MAVSSASALLSALPQRVVSSVLTNSCAASVKSLAIGEYDLASSKVEKKPK
jgi:hypothetical protein